MSTVKFRYNVGIAVAGLVAFFGAVPVAAVHWYLAPILLVPLAVLVWGWRAGTDADRDGLTARALLGGRRLPWARITGLVPDGRHVVAVYADHLKLLGPKDKSPQSVRVLHLK